MELSHIFLGRHLPLQKVAKHGLSNKVHLRFSCAYLHCIVAILLLGLDSDYLTPIQLHHCDCVEIAPLVPQTRHAQLVAQGPTPPAQRSGLIDWLDLPLKPLIEHASVVAGHSLLVPQGQRIRQLGYRLLFKLTVECDSVLEGLVAFYLVLSFLVNA